jgi:hypothetical protein
MTTDKTVYSIAGTRWYQEQLTYEEIGRAGDILSQFSKMFEEEKLKFSDVAKRIYEAGLVPNLFAIILKPHCPTPWTFTGHWFFRILHRISRKNLARTMKLEEMFGVLADFFFINTEWIERLISSSEQSDTRRKALTMMQTMMGILFPLKTLPSSSPTETSAESKPPGVSSSDQKQ